MRRTSRFVALDQLSPEGNRDSEWLTKEAALPSHAVGVGEHLRAVLKPYGGVAGVVFVALLIETMIGALVPLAFRTLIDRVLPNHDQRLLTLVLGGLAAALLLFVAVGVLRDWLYSRLAASVLRDLRARIYEHVQRLSMDFFGRVELGQILARFTTDLASVENAVASATWGVLPTLDVVIATTLLFILDWRLALVAMLIWPFSLAGPRIFAPRAADAAYTKKEAEGEVISAVGEAVAAQSVVKAYGIQEQTSATFHGRNRGLYTRSEKLGFYSALIERTANIGILALQILVLGVGALLTLRGTMTIGTLVSFQALFITLSFALYNVAQYAPNVVQAIGGLRRVAELLAEEERVTDVPGATALPPFARAIEFRDVSFGYDETRMSLEHLNLRIDAGQSVAFVGQSGSGKSTTLNLLLRFYDATGGSVLFDGRDVRSVTQASLRANMAVVLQDNFLFNTSIGENIRVTKPNATQAEVQAAAIKAEIHEFIMGLPHGYDTPVGERGGRLSGGQRQRIAIARAMLRDPRILLLDEATSALDPSAESAINETIARVSRGRTVISITHRLASATGADRIFVLKNGGLVESGTHAQLLQQDGAYAHLWRKQGGFGLAAGGDVVRVEPERLKQVKLLRHIDDALLEELAPLFTTETAEADRDIVREGDPGDRFYMIARGRVQVTKAQPDGSQRRVAVLENGDYFGEIALLENRPRSATVSTLLPCTFLVLHRARLVELMQRVPDLGPSLTSEAERRSRSLVEPV